RPKFWKKVLARSLSRLGAVIDGRLDSVTSRVEGYRAQFEEISSALEAKLTSFIKTSEQAAQKQACLFDARIASTSEQAISLAHENLRTEIMRVQESTTHSVEEQIASLVVGLQQSHAQIEAMSAKLDDSRLRYN